MKKTVVLIIVFMAFIGCKFNKNQSENKNIKLTMIAKGNLHGAGAEGIEKQNIVIKNTSDWNDLLEKMNSINKVSNTFSETKIDFSKYMVIASFDEVKGSGGHSLELKLQNKPDEIIISIIRSSPDGMATTVMSQPYYLAKIPKSNKTVIFK